MSKSPKDTKGPVVKSGPTRGQNRSRNKDGQWRSKRSDSGKSRDKGGKSSGKKGCFLTTAACEFRGLPDDCHELQVLRLLRDEILMKTPEGVGLVEDYYDIAPRLVPLLDNPLVADQVWTDIKRAVEQAEKGHASDAVGTYRKMVETLQRSKGQADLSRPA